jgi:hypothetical protein
MGNNQSLLVGVRAFSGLTECFSAALLIPLPMIALAFATVLAAIVLALSGTLPPPRRRAAPGGFGLRASRARRHPAGACAGVLGGVSSVTPAASVSATAAKRDALTGLRQWPKSRR